MLNRVLYLYASGSWRAPPALLRSTERWRTAAILAGCQVALSLAILTLVTYVVLTGDHRALRLMMLILVAHSILIFIVRHRFGLARERLRQEAIDRDFLICYECGYDLSAPGTSDRCPECGTTWTPESLEHNWRSWMWRTRPR
ncbi:MAG: hypothetical protein SF069_00775 [Phycisphaerae bacterium]|nr:hypothetical protein [Phycisphaerae bacterium]